MPVLSQETVSSITQEKALTNKERGADQRHNGGTISWRENLDALTWNVLCIHAARGQPNDWRLKSSGRRSSGTKLIDRVPVSARFFVYTKNAYNFLVEESDKE